MDIISSKDNELIKDIKKLKDKKHRDINNEYIIEGAKIINEAIEEQANIKQIIICEDCINTEAIPKELMYEVAKYKCNYVTKKVFESITGVVNPQGILAIIEKNNKKTEIDYKQDLIIALDDIQDPGNLGTILRTIDSVGINQILVSKGTVDTYNPKVVRSTMGAIFRVKIIECEDLAEILKETKKNKFKVMVTSLQTSKSIYDIEYKKKVLVIGNEAKGVSEEILEIANEKIKIPMLRKNRKFKCICCNRHNII